MNGKQSSYSQANDPAINIATGTALLKLKVGYAKGNLEKGTGHVRDWIAVRKEQAGMRKQAIMLLVVICLTGARTNAQSGGARPIALVSFSPSVDADCMASVSKGNVGADRKPMQT